MKLDLGYGQLQITLEGIDERNVLYMSAVSMAVQDCFVSDEKEAYSTAARFIREQVPPEAFGPHRDGLCQVNGPEITSAVRALLSYVEHFQYDYETSFLGGLEDNARKLYLSTKEWLDSVGHQI